jgi:rRNA-processing protein FCF1
VKKRSKMQVILDSNFLIDLIRFKIPLEEIFELLGYDTKILTLSSVLNELEKIAKGKSKEAKYAKLALKLIDLKKIEILKIEKSVDEALFSLANEKTIIATNDKNLRKKLKEKGLKSIYIRAKKRLDFSYF